MENTDMKYRQIVEKITKDLLVDLSSLRVWLIILGFAFNVLVLYLVAFHGVDYKIAITSIGLLTAIYYFFFDSKSKEAAAAQAAAEPDTADSDPKTDRDPDN